MARELVNGRYVLITSAFNEADNIEKCINSVLKQTVLPNEWIIINDGSVDNTGAIIKKYSDSYPFIKTLFKENEYHGITGYHAVPNFNFGLDNLSSIDYNFISNLDADIEIDRNDYYEFLLHKFEMDDRLGIASGITYYIDKNGIRKLQWHEPWHTTGALKFYRRQCFESLGKMEPDFGWDGADEMKAMSKGWSTMTFFDFEVNHLGKLRDLERQKSGQFHFNRGFSIYRRGYPFWYIIIKIFQTIKEYSYHSALSLLKGYWNAKTSQEPKILTDEEMKFLRKFHFSRIFKLKNDE